MIIRRRCIFSIVFLSAEELRGSVGHEREECLFGESLSSLTVSLLSTNKHTQGEGRGAEPETKDLGSLPLAHRLLEAPLRTLRPVRKGQPKALLGGGLASGGGVRSTPAAVRMKCDMMPDPPLPPIWAFLTIARPARAARATPAAIMTAEAWGGFGVQTTKYACVQRVCNDRAGAKRL